MNYMNDKKLMIGVHKWCDCQMCTLKIKVDPVLQYRNNHSIAKLS